MTADTKTQKKAVRVAEKAEGNRIFAKLESVFANTEVSIAGGVLNPGVSVYPRYLNSFFFISSCSAEGKKKYAGTGEAEPIYMYKDERCTGQFLNMCNNDEERNFLKHDATVCLEVYVSPGARMTELGNGVTRCDYDVAVATDVDVQRVYDAMKHALARDDIAFMDLRTEVGAHGAQRIMMVKL